MKLILKPIARVLSPRRLWRGGVLLCATALLGLAITCSPRQSLLEEVQALGVLRVATVNSPTTYYIGPGGDPVGFEYDLALGFAQTLGVRLEIELAANPPEAAQMARDGIVHLAAAGIGVTEARERGLRFTRPVQSVVPLLVYRKGRRKPESLADLDGSLRVVAGGAHAERLRELRDTEYPGLRWEEVADVETEELLLAVANGELDYTIANSDLLAINRRYYPDLRTAFALAERQTLAWAFSAQRDRSLLRAAERYFDELGEAELSRLRDRYFGHVQQVDTFGALTLATHVQTRLPRYRKLFEQAGAETGIDWRLLAAIGYQESHWDPSAVSPTGVRGIMQLTAATAQRMNVADREDPGQSILGGSRYLRLLLDQLPPEITEPDRTWLALVAYNIGYGHLLDVRDLTARQGGDPNRWLDVRERLLLLTQHKWHSQTKYGYARGHEALTYVGNVRTYYDMLVWMTGVPATPTEPPPEPAPTPEPERRDKDPLDIDSPIL
ncbi:membrane-bound lytic murein transglycosylase MltF [Sinimarinibacterium thermocellulolyticum]|uniref:Membrane-bound lytic murein transglycosylase F n=1 Tax=Sinimarinibacterium thermocellulolyticum TaxID=3170016 RepID=A0ABV2A9F7_9GAMM